MVELLPFRGILYNPNRVPDLSTVVCPPYDVISDEDRERYHELHPYNSIRLILGKELPQDTQEDNRYTRAARDFETWLSQGILLQDSAPAFYFLEEHYQDEQGTPVTRYGVIGLVRLADYSGASVRPHEYTHEGPKRDRMELMKATGANLSQIFALCTDPSFTLEGIVETLRKGTPRVEVTDREGVERRLYTVTEPAVVAQVEGLLHDKELMIADGHHRYETALAYRDWRRAQEGCAGRPRAYEYMMMYLTNTEGEGLTIYPTHRVLTNLALWDPERFVREVEGLFDVEHFSLGTEEESRRGFLEAMGQDLAGQVRIGMKCKAMEGYFLLTLRDQRSADAILGRGVPPVLRKLDVKVLHTILLGHYLGIRTGEQGHDGKILYVKGVGNALQMLEEDLLHQAVFFLNPPTISLVSEVVRAGERMPQKSTFFYPKLLTGLVFRRIGEWQEEE